MFESGWSRCYITQVFPDYVEIKIFNCDINSAIFMQTPLNLESTQSAVVRVIPQ